MAAEAGIDNKDLFNVLLVAESSAVKDIVTGVPTSVTRGTVSEETGNIYGRVSDTMKKVVGPSGDGNWYSQHNFKGLSAGMKYIVMETDIAPSSDVTSLLLGTNSHAHLSPSVNIGEGADIPVECWSKVVTVYNTEDEVCDTYVNGKLISEDVSYPYSALKDCLRFIVYGEENTDCYLDNYKIYESAIYPTIGAPAAFENGYDATLNAFVDNKSGIISVMNGTTADVEVDGYDIAVLDTEYNPVSGEVSEGDIVLVQKDGNYAYYSIDVLDDNDIVVIGDTYNASNDVILDNIKQVSTYVDPSEFNLE